MDVPLLIWEGIFSRVSLQRIFSDRLHDKIDCMLIKSKHATKLAGAVSTPKDRVRIQNDLDKLKELKSIR